MENIDGLVTALSDFSDFLHAVKGLGLNTVGNHGSTVKRLAPVLGLRPTVSEVQKYIASMYRDRYSNSHIRNTSIALEYYGEFIHVPVRLGRPQNTYSLVQGALSEAEIACMLGSTKSLREKAILSLLSFSGIRNYELCCLRVSDLNTATSSLMIHGTKVGRDRVAMVTGSCLSVLVEYIKERQAKPNEFMFVTRRNKNQMQTQDLRKMVRVAAKRTSITKRVFPHMLRHSLATNLLARGSGLMAIKEQLGHVYISTTMRYLHSSPDRLQQEYRMCAPAYL